MKEKILKVLFSLSLVLSLWFVTGSQSEIYARGVSPLSNVGGEGASTATLTGPLSFSTSSKKSQSFNIKSTLSGSSRIEFTATVTNGYIYDSVYKTKVIDSGVNGGATQKKVVRFGSNIDYVFYPYNSNVAGYKIISYGAYR